MKKKNWKAEFFSNFTKLCGLTRYFGQFSFSFDRILRQLDQNKMNWIKKQLVKVQCSAKYPYLFTVQIKIIPHSTTPCKLHFLHAHLVSVCVIAIRNYLSTRSKVSDLLKYLTFELFRRLQLVSGPGHREYLGK